MFVWTLSLSMIMPGISSESSILPPTFLTTLMFSLSTVILPFVSTTLVTASTAISDRSFLEDSAPFPVMAVSAMLISRFLLDISTLIARELRTSTAFSAASLYPEAIIVGWTSCSIKPSALLKSSPATTAALVVPSPTSSSWVLDTSTTIFAAGCSISISLRMVAPSFVITTSPIESTSILSIPLGPRVVLTASATAFAAIMLLLWASLPLVRLLPSFKMKIGCPAII
ncbi:hypothetical protein SDC9_113221 [bioreactor metagenome]|uniref:Uncharacterized protein n=1 Tax=bioreactor metagenome TaxID=1076179 RepID=A0A645BX51_9ZZZZ